jgi:hypothetical protein
VPDTPAARATTHPSTAVYLTAVGLVSLAVAVSGIRTRPPAGREPAVAGPEPDVAPGVAPT